MLNYADLSKSASADSIVIGDLGSRPEMESVSTAEIIGVGPIEEFQARCRKKLAGMTFVSEGITQLSDGRLKYTARVRSNIGVPGSQWTNTNPLAASINVAFTGVKFLGVKDGKIEFVKMVNGKIRHFKADMDPKADEAEAALEAYEAAHSMFNVMEKYGITSV